MRMSMVQGDMRVAKGIAMFLAPFDTGNVRFNAIKGELTNDGFRIKYSLPDAFYIYFLEEGTAKSQKHVGFIANETVPTIASFISNKYKKRNQSVVNHFKYRSRQAEMDKGDKMAQRELRNQYSTRLDIDMLSKKQKWEHNSNMEIYDENFESRRLG